MMSAREAAEAVRLRRWEDLPTIVDALLDTILRAPAEVGATAHPLGFVHVPLWDYDDGARLRLHLWPQPPYRPQEPAWTVHQHVWPLESFVVQGCIRDERYVVQDDDLGDHRLYRTRYEADDSVLEACSGSVSCDLLRSTRWEAGSAYAVPDDAFHASEAEAPSVTLACSGRPTGGDPLVVGAAIAPPEITYQRRPLDADDLTSLLKRVL